MEHPLHTSVSQDGKTIREYSDEKIDVPEPIARMKNVAGEVGKGMSDLINGGFIGMDNTVADIINLFDTDNSVADHYRGLAQERTNNANYPEGAASAVGSELGSMGVAAPIGGKVSDVLFGGVKVAKNAIGKRVAKLADKGDDEVTAIAERLLKQREFEAAKKMTTKEILEEAPGFIDDATKATATAKIPSIGLISEIVGKLSSSTQKLIDKYYAKAIAPISKRAARDVKSAFEKDLKNKGHDDKYIMDAWDAITKDTPSTGKTLRDALSKKPGKAGSGAGAIAGSANNDYKTSSDGNTITFPDGSTARRK